MLVMTPVAAVSWSRAALRAMVKLPRSGSMSGRVRVASLIARVVARRLAALIASLEEVENLALGVFDPLKTPVLKIESLLDLVQSLAVTVLDGGDRTDRAVRGVEQLIHVVHVVA